MNELRLIILVVGIVIIAIIYFLGTIKYRQQQQRKQPITQPLVETSASELRIAPRLDVDSDFSANLSDLSDFLARSKVEEAEFLPEGISTRDINEHTQQIKTKTESVDEKPMDLFSSDTTIQENVADKPAQRNDYEDISPEHIITLYITAPPIKTFNGPEILAAVKTVGLEFGDMNIFHHYGIGEMHHRKPLFSLVDMFEPGYFELNKIASLSTRGLSMFLRLPTPVDGQVVFELMLNTAQRLANILGGEIRGPDHKLINENRINTIRNKIRLQAH